MKGDESNHLLHKNPWPSASPSANEGRLKRGQGSIVRCLQVLISVSCQMKFVIRHQDALRHTVAIYHLLCSSLPEEVVVVVVNDILAQ